MSTDYSALDVCAENDSRASVGPGLSGRPAAYRSVSAARYRLANQAAGWSASMVFACAASASTGAPAQLSGVTTWVRGSPMMPAAGPAQTVRRSGRTCVMVDAI